MFPMGLSSPPLLLRIRMETALLICRGPRREPLLSTSMSSEIMSWLWPGRINGRLRRCVMTGLSEPHHPSHSLFLRLVPC